MSQLWSRLLIAPFLIGGVAWATAALYLDGPGAVAPGSGGIAILPAGLAAAFLLMSGAVLFFLRPFLRAVAAEFGLVLLVVLWWLSLEPGNGRDWMPDVANVVTAEIDGDRLTLHHVRNFDYRSQDDYTERWETRHYDLSKLTGVDLFLSYWGSPWIAHTVISWEFEGGDHLPISIETRKEKGEEYSALRGFFRQFELYYVVSDERDLIRLRTNFRNEDVYLYRLETPVDVARDVLLDYVRELNRLATRPKWYNAVTHNCTTVIRHHVANVARASPWNWRLLLNGRLDELAYRDKNLDTTLPFPALRRLSRINERAKAAGDSADFSRKIREGLPGARPGVMPGS